MGYDVHFKKLKAVKTDKKTKSQKARPVRSPRPSILPAIISVLLLGVGVWFWLIGGDGVDRILNRIEIQFFGGQAMASEAKPAETKPEAKEKTAAKEPEKKDEKQAGSKSFSEEEINLFKKLEARKKELDAKQEQLKVLEAELQKQKEEFEKKVAALEQMRTQIATKLEGQVAVDEQKVQALVALYQNMKAPQAAKIIEGLNDDLAIEVLMKMKNKSAAEILNVMSSEKAKKLSEQYAGYKALANKPN